MTTVYPGSAIVNRHVEADRFVRKHYGVRGTFALHRAALGLDLLRAPVNVLLALPFMFVRLLAKLLIFAGAKRAGRWLAMRRIFLKSDVARRIEADLTGFVAELDTKGIGPNASPETLRREIIRHTETRNAVAEITTSLIVLIVGLMVFHQATPGVISMAGPLAELRAQSSAVEGFALGQGLGRVWYKVFPVDLSLWHIILTGVVLAVICAVVSAFAGLVADPIQVLTGTHRRRLIALLNRLDKAGEPNEIMPGLEKEHWLARFGDIGDTALSLWRVFRG